MRLLPSSRSLGEITTYSPSPQYSQSLHTQTTRFIDPDIVVIVTSLLCAILCVLGLVVVARCTPLRHFSAGNIHLPSPSPPKTGLNKKILESFPKITIGTSVEDKFSECAICLSEFEEGEVVRVMPQCSHGFHVKCIDMWLQSHTSCPSCRRVFVSTPCDKCNCNSS